MTNEWPNFFIIGAAKAGTTSLYQYLRLHPQIFMAEHKEPHFFSQVRKGTPFSQPVTTTPEYLQLFAEGVNYSIRGEASTSYLWSPETAVRLHRQIPDARILVVLRDPIERAYSHYLMDVRTNRQHLPLYEALCADYELQDKGWHVSNLYVELGLYARQLANYYQRFPKSQICVLFFEELTQEPVSTLTKTAEFLQVDPTVIDKAALNIAHNPFQVQRSSLRLVQKRRGIRRLYQSMIPLTWRAEIRNRFFMKPGVKPAIDARAMSFLQELYAPEIGALEQLLGRSLPQLRKSWK